MRVKIWNAFLLLTLVASVQACSATPLVPDITALAALPAGHEADPATPREPAVASAVANAKDATVSASPVPPATATASGVVEPPMAPLVIAKPKPKSRDQVIAALKKEIVTLKSQVLVSQIVASATQEPNAAPHLGGKVIYRYSDNDIYKVYTGLNRITDIQLQPGEKLTHPPLSGDTVRWKLGITQSGAGENETVHVILKPLEADIETNVLITTDKHVYQLQTTVSDQWYMPSLAWNYPQEEAALNTEMAKTAQKNADTVEPIRIAPELLRFDYDVDGHRYDWAPLRVFDDGAKTYVQMPATVKVSEAPVLFVLDGNEPTLVNYRVKGDFYIVDRLFDKAQLRVGADKQVNIRRKSSGGFWKRVGGRS